MNNERSALLLGNEALEILKNKTVLVVGIGGVGSFCVEALARTGIGHLILVDKDKIESSNINRQLLATTETIDQVKVAVMKKRIQTLNPECKVDTYDCFYDCSMDEKIFSQRIDFVIDCIDSIKSKQDLAMACIQRDIPFLSSMGTARRLDPSKLEIMELEKTSYDPIAKRMRNWKRKNKIRNKIWVVCSTEPPRPVEAGKPLPSMIFVPASAGLLLASECVKKLINK
ncbi:tRNA threonylcarbamoyladenosine dehydratase [Faecalitalea cylindroides]|uniref:ThiF family protein n=1 Tax=Faecalitalea cylindroides ATCC 27803 TaxID=649755 RepID=U2QL44_9FIRM|nr:tRNA threonylcarbamoyladenosine dehydratase [Faecalitalea cylindroides]ERK42003.1 ThiF family protein [[Eubacterium] cylindroides ATCC 27803] [Faecalitalea cylindroides ATCC 27803]